ncbi:MAG: hypothetical protein ACREL5_05615 [Gemmatimonadales bacterium]
MPAKEVVFTYRNARPKIKESRELQGQGESILVGVQSVDVTCPDCRKAWTAREFGSGHFSAALGGALYFRCPGCDAQGSTTVTALLG